VHGGSAAVRDITRGEPLTGLAAQEERQVKLDLAESGRLAMLREIAVRAHTALRLYWNAVQTASDAGDLEALDGYVRRFGWLAGVAGRAWREVRTEEQIAPDLALDYDAMVEELQKATADD
jgi:hypothetical protein